MKHQTKILGVILAGGHSQRFGSDKAAVVIDSSDSRTTVQRMSDRLHEFDLDVAVVTHAKSNLVADGFAVVHDIYAECGPLGGIFTVMKLIPADAYLVLTCDMPLVSHSLLEALINNYAGNFLSAVFSQNGILQPFPGVFSKGCLSIAKALLADNCYVMREFLEQVDQLQTLSWPNSCHDFLNMNTQDDFLKVKELLQTRVSC